MAVSKALDQAKVQDDNLCRGQIYTNVPHINKITLLVFVVFVFWAACNFNLWSHNNGHVRANATETRVVVARSESHDFCEH